MKRSSPKNAKLQERIAALQRELKRVEGTIDELDSAVRAPDRESAAVRLRELTGQPAREPGAVKPPAENASALAETPTDDEFESGLPKMKPDRRFASYFVTGSLQSVRPLRTERRVQRNRAIIMAIIALVLLYGVISLLL